MDEIDSKNQSNAASDTGSDTYDFIHSHFAQFNSDDESDPDAAEEDDVKNNGEIYFSANGSSHSYGTRYSDADFDRFSTSVRTSASASKSGASRTAGNPGRNGGSATKAYGGNKAKKTAASSSGKSQPIKKKRKRKKRKNSKKSVLMAFLILIFVILLSAIVRIPIMGCMNDILAIDREDTQVRVILDRTMTTSQVLDLLDRKGLIYSANFCKIVSNLLGYAKVREYEGGPYVDRTYPAGTYYLSPDMGVEGMLREIYTAGIDKSTVSITFPEGFTVDQIIEKLALNGVASEKALYDVLDDESFFENYDYLKYVTDKHQRYRMLEGYLYPDTYEFYVGENPKSVFNRFLTNFTNKWNANFAKLAENSSYTIDQIITIASILQKEASDAEQMGVISSIIHNRLESSSFPFINCDSTAKYISAHEDRLRADGSFATLMMHYETYQVTGLPVGPICNPGLDAIRAALLPDSTDYYYFLHDKEGRIYTARTVAEHQANEAYIAGQ